MAADDQTPTAGDGNAALQKDLLRIAHMFRDFRDDPLMRELCRLAVKCAQERLIGAH